MISWQNSGNFFITEKLFLLRKLIFNNNSKCSPSGVKSISTILDCLPFPRSFGIQDDFSDITFDSIFIMFIPQFWGGPKTVHF